MQRDEGGQLERIGEVEPAELPGGDLGDDEVAALDRSLERDPCVGVVAQLFLPGAGAARRLNRQRLFEA